MTINRDLVKGIGQERMTGRKSGLTTDRPDASPSRRRRRPSVPDEPEDPRFPSRGRKTGRG